MHIHAFRLRPKQDLKEEIARFARERGIQAGFIITCVGSLQRAAIRFANQNETTILEGKYEIVSLVGTLEKDGLHLHISLSDSQGAMVGGHLQDGSLVYTTAEIVIGEATGLIFRRVFDAETGYPELVVH
jgi:predicted DNA-binding protein with PD1-like motif